MSSKKRRCRYCHRTFKRGQSVVVVGPLQVEHADCYARVTQPLAAKSVGAGAADPDARVG